MIAIKECENECHIRQFILKAGEICNLLYRSSE